MENNMKKIGRLMSILMGVTLSFCLSLIGNLTSGHFTLPGFLLSFVLSTVISLIIGFFVPMKKISDSFCEKRSLKQGSIPRRCIESLISDLIYTPVITVAMVLLAYFTAVSQGGAPPLLPMLLSSLLISLAAGFVLIFIFMPLYLGLLMKKYGITPGDPPGSSPKYKQQKNK